jgi:predicted RNA binding protein YcfA (HicA-like mRNA interferase family)
VKLPRDVSGRDLARRLRRYGYEVTRQAGSHMRLSSTARATTHHVTIPDHRELRVGTLRAVLGDVAMHLEIDVETVVEALFGS